MKPGNKWKDKWDARYKDTEYAYGVQANEFLKAELASLKSGKILFPAEGEGRNAVFAAINKWDVFAFDISEEGRKKAQKLAQKNRTILNYQVGELPDLYYESESFDVIALIFAHFPAPIKSAYHKHLNRLLKKDGIIIFEAFSKKHLEYRTKKPQVGGPEDIESLFSEEELRNDFQGFQFLKIEETEVELNEGICHRGKGCVIHFVARKL